jgi:predicted glycogen debranching enzyme
MEDMAVLHFDKNELGNLEYSLQREMLSTNRAGGYMSTTIVCCNTRKYHGLMVCPKDDDDENNYVLLSSVDETVVQHDQTFNLAIHRFPGVYEPRGHKYITDFTYTPTPAITYRVGGVVLKKELLWIHSRTQLLIRYTLLDARSDTQLRLRPFLAFRDRHGLSKANLFADTATRFPAACGAGSTRDFRGCICRRTFHANSSLRRIGIITSNMPRRSIAVIRGTRTC